MGGVVSLVPSVTETLLAWGVEPVAVTRFCDAPGRRTVGGTKRPDVAAVVALRPDLVVMDRQENRREDAEALREAGITLHVTDVRALDDVRPALARLAAALGLPEAQAGLAGPDAGVGGPQPGAGEAAIPPGAPAPPLLRAWVPIWRRPWMSINQATYGSSLLGAAGFANVAATHPDPYPVMTLEEAAAGHPQVVLAPSDPYPFGERHRGELEAVAPAVFVDGREVFWWGARTVGALDRLRRLAEQVQAALPEGPEPGAPRNR